MLLIQELLTPVFIGLKTGFTPKNDLFRSFLGGFFTSFAFIGSLEALKLLVAAFDGGVQCFLG